MSNHRALAAGTLVIASHNQGKITEMSAMLEPWQLTVENAASLNLPEPEETGTTYKENALIKARSAAASGLPALADDSGFEITALNGAPGVYSARWAGKDKDFNMAMQQIWQALSESKQKDRSCRFVCALALVWPDGHEEIVEGDIKGQLCWPPRGDNGFGYDPIFCPDGYEASFAEFEPELKHSMSHRARAFNALADRCLATTPKKTSPQQ